MGVIVRDATDADMAGVAAIYAHHVLHGVGTFEEIPPPTEEIVRRWQGVVRVGLPWLVAEAEGRLLGYAYATPFRPRSAYRYVAEDSVYVAPDGQRRGVGKALLTELTFRCEALGLRQLVAVIGDSENAGSIQLHAALGFLRTGAFEDVGFKRGRWLDIVFMQRALNGGADTPPRADQGLTLS